MKKITNFIVEKKYLILFIFIISAFISIILSNKVNLNYEISEYLKDDSNVKIGLNIMNEEFKTNETTFKLMFKDLTKSEIKRINNELINTKNVLDVKYKTKKKYILYEITLKGDKESKCANDTYKTIVKKYKSYDIYTSGDVASRNTKVITTFVLFCAILCGTIILIIMCDSVVEVFLFLFTILIAVLLNKGTNIIFNSVSSITDSITAILQLALSMDYSIMLMNRFNQEKKIIKDKTEAMKNALYKAVTSISSSSITTVVGLLALIFMSFKIGKDLGFVLAKGVLCSLISTFFVLPGLILIFNKQIEKTKKKSPKINMNKLSKFSYKFRYLLLIVFALLFITSYFLKGNLGIYYIDQNEDHIKDIFKKENEIALVYNNKDEESISNYCNTLSDNNKLTNVLCYGNTLNQELTYKSLNNKLKDLGVDINIDNYLLKILYYKYYNKETNKITLNDLIQFINNTVYKNKDINITSDTKKEIDLLSNFTNKDIINKNMTKEELSSILNIDSNTINDLIIYYNSKNINKNIKLKDFILFMKDNVINNNKYNITNEQKEYITLINNIIENKNNKLSSSSLSKLLNIDENEIKKIIMFYLTNSELNDELSINEITNVILNNKEQYKDYITDEMIEQIKTLNLFSDKEFINNDLTKDKIIEIFNIDSDTVDYLMLTFNKDSFKPIELINILLDNNIVTDSNKLGKLTLLKNIIESTENNITYNYIDISNILNIDSNNMKLIYAYNKLNNTNMSIKDLLNIIIDNNLSNDSNILKLNNILNNLDKEYSSNELSKLLNISTDNTNLLYGLYYTKTNDKISLNNLITFINNELLNDNQYKSQFKDNKTKLETLNTIIDYTNNNTILNKDEMYSLLSKLSNDIDKSMIDIIYIYYGSVNNYNNSWTLTIEQMVNYLNKDIINDNRFNNYLNEDLKTKIKNSNNTLNDAKKLLVGKKYSRIILTSNMSVEGKEVDKLIKNIKKDLSNKEIYIVGNSAMANEMNETFNDELNLITILTMSFIFIVVAITFKSIIIPIVLVLTIQCAVFTTMGILSLVGGNVYFISLLIVQAILMGATIDYAIVYTTYYVENRKTKNVKESIKDAYTNSIHTIITSSLILCICTLIVALLTNASAAKICETIAEGAFASTLLIIFILPGVLASVDKLIIKRKH